MHITFKKFIHYTFLTVHIACTVKKSRYLKDNATFYVN